MRAEIYTKDNCGYCVQAKTLMDIKGIDYSEISAVENRESMFERVEAATGSPPKTVPQIFIDGQYVGGHDKLVKFLAEKS